MKKTLPALLFLATLPMFAQTYTITNQVSGVKSSPLRFFNMSLEDQNGNLATVNTLSIGTGQACVNQTVPAKGYLLLVVDGVTTCYPLTNSTESYTHNATTGSGTVSGTFQDSGTFSIAFTTKYGSGGGRGSYHWTYTVQSGTITVQ